MAIAVVGAGVKTEGRMRGEPLHSKMDAESVRDKAKGLSRKP